MDDEELLNAWRGGDENAGFALYDRYANAIIRFFGSKVSEGVDDLVQSTFLALREGRDRIRKGGSVRSYLFGAAHNILRAHLRTRSRDPVDLSTTSARDLGPSASALIGEVEEHRVLLEALRSIPLELQIVLELYYWEAMSGSEIADVLGIPEGTVRARLRRAKELLLDAIRNFNRSPPRRPEPGPPPKAPVSPSVLASTADNLARWAASLRDVIATPKRRRRDEE